MQCPNCQRENDPAYRFCIFCGTPLPASEVRKRSEAAESPPVDDTSLDTADLSQQNVPSRQMEVVTNYAGFRRRFVAWIIDVLAIVALLAIIGLAVDALLSPPGGYVDAQVGAFWIYITWIPLSSLYIIGFWAWRGQTPGKMAMRIKIIRSDGNSLGIGGAIRRYIGYVVLVIITFIVTIPALFIINWVPWLKELRGLFMFGTIYLMPALVVLIIYWLGIVLNRKKQGLHDKIAKTYVVNTH